MPNAAVRSAKAATAKKKTRTKLNLEDLNVGEISDAPGAFDGGLGPDHPLTIAFNKSYSDEVPVKIDTTTPDLVEKVVRRLAAKKDLSCRVRSDSDSVTIEVRDRKPRSPKPVVETASDEEVRSEE